MPPTRNQTNTKPTPASLILDGPAVCILISERQTEQNLFWITVLAQKRLAAAAVDHPTLIQKVDAIRDAQGPLHVLLDKKNRRPRVLHPGA